jgi:hypothetical protein
LTDCPARREVPQRRKLAAFTRTFLEVLGEVSHAAHLEASTIVASDELLNEAQRRHLATVARVAVVAGNAAAPLGLASDCMCSVLAVDTLTDAVCAVAAAHASLRSVAPPETESSDSSRTELPALLPYVHTSWPFYMSVLTSGQLVAASRVLEQLPLIVYASGGDFVRQRFACELWTPLRRMLLHGTPQANQLADAAPGTIVRLQRAALSCLLAIAGNDQSREALADVVGDAADVLGTLARSSGNPELKSRAVELLHALSSLDPDAVWLVLFKLRSVQPPACATLPSLLACR